MKTIPYPSRASIPRSDWEILSGFTYPLAFSDELTDGILHRKVLDEEYIAYRTQSGKVVVAKDLCIHRGAPLSLGRKEGDEIICAYHGFRYGSDGQCTRVPAQPDRPIPKKLCLLTCACEEKYGIIWFCPGGQQALKIPDWPEAEGGEYRVLHIEPMEWDCSASRQMENFMDVAHFSWIHTGTFGNPDTPEVPDYRLEEIGETIHVEYPYIASNPSNSGVSGEETVQRWMLYDLDPPFTCRLRVEYPDNRYHCIFNAPVPVDRYRTRIMFFIARNFDHDTPAEDLLNWERNILAEDKPVVERQRPEELPLDLSEEFHIRCDRFSASYRKRLREFGLGGSFSS